MHVITLGQQMMYLLSRLRGPKLRLYSVCSIRFEPDGMQAEGDPVEFEADNSEDPWAV